MLLEFYSNVKNKLELKLPHSPSTEGVAALADGVVSWLWNGKLFWVCKIIL